MKREMPKHR